MFRHGLCLGDPEKILRMPIRMVLWWFDIQKGWAEAVVRAQKPDPNVIRPNLPGGVVRPPRFN